MSLDTYANLKLEIIDWSKRDDMDLRIDTFIDLAESEMYANAVEPLRIRDGETRATATVPTDSRFVALPTGYNEMRRLRLTDAPNNWDISYRTPEQMVIEVASGRPRYFTVTSQIEFERVPDSAYTLEMQYHADFTPLSASNTSNVVLTNHPTIYLFGALWALHTWTEEPEEAARYYTQFIAAIKGANKKDKKGRYGPAPVMRVEGSTP